MLWPSVRTQRERRTATTTTALLPRKLSTKPDVYFQIAEEQVNSLAFQYLTEDMIKELVPRIGRRAIFRHKYIEFKRRGDKNVSLQPLLSITLSLPRAEVAFFIDLSIQQRSHTRLRLMPYRSVFIFLSMLCRTVTVWTLSHHLLTGCCCNDVRQRCVVRVGLGEIFNQQRRRFCESHLRK